MQKYFKVDNKILGSKGSYGTLRYEWLGSASMNHSVLTYGVNSIEGTVPNDLSSWPGFHKVGGNTFFVYLATAVSQ